MPTFHKEPANGSRSDFPVHGVLYLTFLKIIILKQAMKSGKNAKYLTINGLHLWHINNMNKAFKSIQLFLVSKTSGSIFKNYKINNTNVQKPQFRHRYLACEANNFS